MLQHQVNRIALITSPLSSKGRNTKISKPQTRLTLPPQRALVPQHSSPMGPTQRPSPVIAQRKQPTLQRHALRVDHGSLAQNHLSRAVQVCFMLLASPALRKLGNVAGTGGGGGGLTARKKWGGTGALGALFTPSAVRGLSRDAQVGGVAA
jgi:hypothetical protein